MGRKQKHQEIARVASAVVQKALHKIDRKILNLKLGDGGLVAFSSFSYDSGVGICNLMTNIAQGSGLNQRIGNDVRLHRLRGTLFIAPGDNYNCVRVLIVASKGLQVSSTTSTFTQQVFSGITGAAQVAAPVDELSFDVLFDKKIVPFFRPIDGNSSATVGVPEVVNFDVNLGNRLVTYNQGATGNSGKPVWLILVSDSAAVAHAGCVQAGLRLDFSSGE